MILVNVEVTLGARNTWMRPLHALGKVRLVQTSLQCHISRPVLETKQTVRDESIGSFGTHLGVNISMDVKLAVLGLLLVTTRHQPCV